MLKCQFHTHCAGDPCDNIKHSPKKLIKEAARLNYDILAISCHKKLIFNKNLQKIAKKHNIILIPSIELAIDKKHILAINIDKDIEKVKNFKELKEYKKSHPNCFVVAPHPFFPGRVSLKDETIKNINLFDAIELSFCYTKTKDYNKKAIKFAKRWKKPMIATSDCHILKYLDLAYTEVDSPKNINSIIKAIKQNKVKLIHAPIKHLKLAKILLRMLLSSFVKTPSL